MEPGSIIRAVCSASISLHIWGWLGEAKVSCILRHRGVELILAYSLARLAILEAGKSSYFFCFFTLIHYYSFSFSFPFISCTISSSSPFLWETTQNDSITRVDISLNSNTINSLHIQGLQVPIPARPYNLWRMVMKTLSVTDESLYTILLPLRGLCLPRKKCD